MGYIIFIYSFGFTIPLTIILISYTKLIKTIRLRVRIMYVIAAIKPPISFSKSNFWSCTNGKMEVLSAQLDLQATLSRGGTAKSRGQMRREFRDTRLTIMVATMVCDVMSDWVFLAYKGVLCPVLLFFGMELSSAQCQAKAECAKWNMENTPRYSAGFKISILITISLTRSKFGLIRSKLLQGKLLSPDLDALCGRVYLRNCRLYIYALIGFFCK